MSNGLLAFLGASHSFLKLFASHFSMLNELCFKRVFLSLLSVDLF